LRPHARATRKAHGRKPEKLVREQDAITRVIAAFAPEPPPATADAPANGTSVPQQAATPVTAVNGSANGAPH
jgi:hypothetical protein